VTKTQLDTKENSSSSRLLPTGAVLDFTGKNSPSGFILASGRTIGNNGSGATERANADTLNLFTLYFDDYIDAELPMQNSSGSNTPRSTYATALLAFNALSRITIPDVRGRVTVGKDNMGTDANRITTAGCSIDGNTMLAAGGAQNHVLTTAQLAAHSHSTTVGDDSPDHSHQYSKSGFSAFNKVGGYDPYGVNVSTVSTAGASTRHSHSVTVNNTGSNQAHNNMQPSIIVLKIIKL
jgi:microcystin-dependent protein